LVAALCLKILAFSTQALLMPRIPIALFFAVTVLLLDWSANASTLTGQATIIDGDTLEIHGASIHPLIPHNALYDLPQCVIAW
jgi:hypothetical protein